MAWRYGSLPRAAISAARSSSTSSASTSSLPRLRPSSPPFHANRLNSRWPLFSSLPTRPIGALGCTQLLIPLYTVGAATRLTSHISVEVRGCCELSQGT